MSRSAAKAEPRRKKVSHGGAAIAEFSPDPAAKGLKSLNMHITFEECLKLHLALGCALAEINQLNRAYKAGKLACVGVTVYPGQGQIVVNRARLKDKAGTAQPSKGKAAKKPSAAAAAGKMRNHGKPQ